MRGSRRTLRTDAFVYGAGVPETEEFEEPARSLAGGLIESYVEFAGLQQQRLQTASYMLERQMEIDDPITASKTVLQARYSHLDSEKIEHVLRVLAPHVKVEESAEDAQGPSLQLGEGLSDALSESMETLTAPYGIVCFTTLAQEALESRRSGGNTDDLRASLFAGLIADFESFMVSLMTDLYTDNPRRMPSKERTFTANQVLAINDMAAFREELIDHAVVDIMRGSFADWLAALSRDHGVNVGQYTDSSQLLEVFQRRHVLVHNGGRVSRLYRMKCPDEAVKLGEKISVTPEYFQMAADRLVVVALGLTVNAILQHCKEDATSTETRTADWVYELLLRRRYQAVHDFVEGLPFDRLKDDQSSVICRVNGWLALKRLDRFDECRKEVEAWQVGHLEDRFKLAKHALLGELELAAALCKKMRESDELSIKHWIEWPMLEEVRAYEALVVDTSGESDTRSGFVVGLPRLATEGPAMSTEDY